MIALFMFFVTSCSKHKDDLKTDQWEGLKFPSHFPPPYYKMEDNPVTKDGFELGKKLFYDPILSRNNTISCGSCHIQSSSFTHHGHDVSHGIDDKLGRRNAPPIQNVLWEINFFWDGGVHNIDLIPLNAIQNPVEMDENLNNVIAKLQKNTDYQKLFEKAFGSNVINSTHFLQALSQFMSMLISADSKYDSYLKGETALTPDELEGMAIFNQKCSQCHSGSLFTDNSFRNNGLSSDFTFDKGRYEISLIDSDIGKFKVPSLRNVMRTAPYMHNGKIETLEAVLEHYSTYIKKSPTLDPILGKENQLGIPLTSKEKQKIIIFLNTLTDEKFIRNPMFSE